jgi:beta-lactamase superfamily II metal-dependent hydrolase
VSLAVRRLFHLFSLSLILIFLFFRAEGECLGGQKRPPLKISYWGAAFDQVVPLQLAMRKGSESCALQWESWDGLTRFCLSRARWELLFRSADPTSLEPEVLAVRTRAPLVNEFQSTHPRAKQPYRIIELSRFPFFPQNHAGFFEKKVRHLLHRCLFRLEVLREEIAQQVARQDTYGLLRRILLDERPSLRASSSDADDWTMEGDFLRLSGWVHLLTASGIHLLAWISFIHFFLRGVGHFSFYGIQFSTFHRVSLVLALLSLLFYGVLVGGRSGLVRPIIAILVRQGLFAFGGKPRFASVLGVTLLLDQSLAWVLSSWGAAEWAMGRMHYALAVAGGIWGWHRTEEVRQKAKRLGRLARWKAGLSSHAAMAISSWLWIVPLDLAHGSLISPWTPIVSMITIPILGGVLFPGLLFWACAFVLGAEDLASAGFQMVGQATTYFCQNFQAFILDSGFAQVALPNGAAWVLVFLALFSLLLGSRVYTPLTRTWTFSGAWLGVCFFLFHTLGANLARTEVHQLDVGQGDAALLRIEQGSLSATYLIDAGDEFSLNSTHWKKIQAGAAFESVDSVLLTHLDSDHAGGLKNLVRVIPVHCVVASHQQWQSARGQALRRELAPYVDQIVSLEEASGSGGLRSCVPPEIRWAHLETFAGKKETANSSMNAYHFRSPHFVEYINFGDADWKAEGYFQKWVEGAGSPTKHYRIFKISHHGSRFSTSLELLKRLQPDEVWISAGVGNSFGHPSLDVLRSLATPGRSWQLFRTDQKGRIGYRAVFSGSR